MNNNFKNSDYYKKIFLFHDSIVNRIISRESGWLEFKESFNWNSRDKYAKSMAAFANNKGGFIVFGVKDKPRDFVGLQSCNFETIDESKITEYLNSVFSPEILFEKFLITVQSKNVGILYVHQSNVKPIVCLKYDGDLKEAEIYYRYNARSEKMKYPEIKILLDIIKEDERKNWMEHFEKISKIGPANVAIMDIVGGEVSGRGGTLMIDRKLVPKLKFISEGRFKEGGKPVLKLIGDVKPVSAIAKSKNIGGGVRITNDPSAPMIRLEEEDILRKKYPLSYNELITELIKRYKNFVRNSYFHKLRKEFMIDKNLSRTRYLDPDNLKGTKKDFYSPDIIKKFDKYYIKKRK
ncbi:MAG: hypothetical protein ACD_7C00039G0010 [uncultured bacterium]|nr:MAG: hypothetical protein ACD_7C00039G0010 [uncultured bacterium]KKP67734.1 MAG: hypothetical protein UR66_C0011G0010 [Candidatus Moranbacteria bacterium GW2011_GWE1_35_17]KKP72432.1 MAG: hypothetical protein UR65_C0015G0002 [Candidatus Moranbacteria bacterium GW2011_GWE2_35_164]KKP81067.1 MAG: hypothetical protein UR82_C0073G0005 [Candidatus Moranbacteria bacterium GW2011_GWF1_35_5]KKP84143.1 MAG: hypothetical protein UR83_C0026G0006 [Candidatus Moranbacteria bacterium GW2011_GWF2_35_54]HB